MNDPLASLTPTERRVAGHVSRGLTNAEIAAELLCGEETVKTHVSNIFRRLNLHKRSELVALATAGRVITRIVYRDTSPCTCTSGLAAPAHEDTFELRRLGSEVAQLRRQIANPLQRRRPDVAASKATVTDAVRRVGAAEGRQETAERLRELAAEAEAWASLLAIKSAA